MTYDEFIQKFKPIVKQNTGEPKRFKTFGKDYNFVRVKLDKFVWTEIDSNGEGVIIPGNHIVNRISYLVCDNAWTQSDEHIEIVLN